MSSQLPSSCGSFAARRLLYFALLGITSIWPAQAQESWTEVSITQVSRSKEIIGATYQLSCAGTRCRGHISLEVNTVFYRFEAMALFSPHEVKIALEPVADDDGHLMHLQTNSFDPIVLFVDETALASKTVDLVEVAQPQRRPLVREPVLRLGVVASIRIDVRAPATTPRRTARENPI